MRRHPALAQLSRDHHHALVVAQRLRRASGTNAGEARAAFLDFWQREGQAHFREEEDVLLPTFARYADPGQHPAVGEVLVDHLRIRSLAKEAASDGWSLAVLQSLGNQLERHVRREERELFPLIQQALPEHELAKLAWSSTRRSDA